MQTDKMKATMSWLRNAGFVCNGASDCAHCSEALQRATEISRAFSSGNYANAYESTDLDDFEIDEMVDHERAAFVLGFFGSYSLGEIGDREIFDECYFSEAGQACVAAGYTDSRADEYAEESGEE